MPAPSALRQVLAASALAVSIVFGLCTALPAQQQTPRIAAASSLNVVLPAIVERFRQERGERVDVVFASSGTLARQIQDGAPFELFLAADEAFPGRLTASGLTRDAGVVYALGRLAIFAPYGSPLTVDAQLNGLATLVDAGRLSRFAIANPSTAPYGAAAEAVLRKRGLWDRARSSLVMGDTVAQAAQFATTGNAVGGLVAYSLVLSPELARRGTYAVIDASEHPPLRQRMVLMKTASPVAQHFYQYLQQAPARELFGRNGFSTP